MTVNQANKIAEAMNEFGCDVGVLKNYRGYSMNSGLCVGLIMDTYDKRWVFSKVVGKMVAQGMDKRSIPCRSDFAGSNIVLY